jgi:hypothetical protein
MDNWNKQRGGAFKVNGFVTLALLAAAVTSAIYGYYEHSHRVIELHIALPTTKISVKTPDDEYVTHTYPPEREVCTSFDTICWIRI